MNPTSTHEDWGLIPGPTQWVKVLALPRCGEGIVCCVGLCVTEWNLGSVMGWEFHVTGNVVIWCVSVQ